MPSLELSRSPLLSTEYLVTPPPAGVEQVGGVELALEAHNAFEPLCS